MEIDKLGPVQAKSNREKNGCLKLTSFLSFARFSLSAFAFARSFASLTRSSRSLFTQAVISWAATSGWDLCFSKSMGQHNQHARFVDRRNGKKRTSLELSHTELILGKPFREEGR